MSVVDTELARLEHENLIAGEELLASLTDTSLIERYDGVALLAAGLPVPFFNQVIVERDDGLAAGIVASVGALRERGLPFIVNLRVGTDDRFVATMSDLGLVPISEGPSTPGMALYPIPGDSITDLQGYEIRRVADAQTLEDHKLALSAGFGMPVEWVHLLMTLKLLERPDCAFYTGYAGGKPVTTGAGILTGRTIGIYNISTADDARRHGYGEAMTRHIALEAARQGSDVAALQASQMGLAMYERLGYRTVVQYKAYVEPDAPTTA
jgi:ribosomal protein S18 acetylase RimI-like enzyme